MDETAESKPAARPPKAGLRDSAEHLRAILESALDCIVTMDHDGRIAEFNPAAESTFGYRRADVIGKLMADLIIPPALREAHRRGLAHYLKTGEGPVLGKRIEITGMRADGREFPVELTIIRVPGTDPPFFTGYLRDLTQRRTLEEQLRQSQKMEAIGRLAGGIAHDFNNLLTVIAGRSHIMLDNLSAADPLRGQVEQIHRTAERATILVRQLLAFSRKQLLQPTTLDLNAVVAGMERMLRPLIGDHIEVVLVPAPGLRTVRADPSQIEQVILNLALNARDAMPRGGRLTLQTANADIDAVAARLNPDARPGAFAMLAVSDTGAGMTAETQRRVFEPFFTTKGMGRGTGLGLATVYGIVKQSDGYIRVSSEPGRGTRFEVYLPQASGDAAEPEPPRPPAAVDAPGGRETVLLVEDQDDVRDLARDVLRMSGYEVVEARSGMEAVQLFAQHRGPIHLLLTDIVMPQMSGPEIAATLVGRHPGLKVLYMTGYTDEAIVPTGVAGADALLLKPFSTQVLAQKVREVLGPLPTD